ncbi:hypothetical protein PG996_004863 [Apiospora saccharicola]|uniref:Rhodopsin domain-containing protein n=1 Tax=Apiospora saccharicola TaxID=335842 RepID=A0ABR1VJU6_9PEZI
MGNNDDDRGPELVYVAIVFTVMSLVCLGLRCYTMGVILKRFFLADWTAVLTGLNQCALCAFTLLGVHYGVGKHVADVSPEDRIEALKWKWAGQVSYVVGSTLIKLVAGLLLLRLFAGQRWQRISIIVLMALVGLIQTLYLFVAIFQCTPIPFYWFRYTADAPVAGKCLSPILATVPTYVSILLGVVSDWYLALLPITLVRKIQMEKRAKNAIVGILAIGSMASLANVVRIPYAKQLLSNPDYLYNSTDLAIWSIIECALGLMATSLAMLRPLFVRLHMLASTQVLSTFYSRSRTGRRRGASGLASSRSRAASNHRPPPRSRVLSEPPMTLHSLNSESQLSHKTAPFPPPSSSKGGEFRVAITKHRKTNNNNNNKSDYIHEMSEPPPALFPARDRSNTMPRSRESQADYMPGSPSVGTTLDGQQRQSREEAWFMPLQPPPPPPGAYHSRGFSS